MYKYGIMVAVIVSSHGISAMGPDERSLNWDTQKYEENLCPQEHFFKYALSQIALEPSSKVLDVGCGPGKNTVEIAKMVPHGSVLGIDASAAQIEQARRDFSTQGNLTFEQIDITQLGLNKNYKNYFNFCNASCSLSWVENQRLAYANIEKALMYGGKMVALVGDEDAVLLQSYRKAFTYPRWRSYFEKYKPSFYPSTIDKIKKLLRIVGFASLMVKTAEIPCMMLSKEKFLAAIGATPGVKDAIPQDQYQDFLKDVMSEYLKKVPEDHEGNVPVDAGLILVIAQKPHMMFD